MSIDELTRAAYHEVGHAIACYKRGHQFSGIKLYPDSGPEEPKGEINIPIFIDFCKKGINLEDIAVTFLGGPIAVWYRETAPGKALPSDFWPPKHDDTYGIKWDFTMFLACLRMNPESTDTARFNIHYISHIRDIPQLLPFDGWSSQAEELIEEHWQDVKKLSEALMSTESKSMTWDRAMDLLKS